MSATMTADDELTITTLDPFEAVSHSAAEAENLRVRATLMEKINQQLDELAWTQMTIAEHLGLGQPRVSDLRRNRVSKFSTDALVVIGAKLGIRVAPPMPEDVA